MPNDRPIRVRLLGEAWVLARLGPRGDLRAFADRCPHRLAPLSIGSIVPDPHQEGDGSAAPSTVLQCGYHGWCFGADGGCVEIPALGPGARAIPPKARLRAAFGVAERHGMVFVCPTTPLEGLESPPDVAEAHDAAFMAGDLPIMRAPSAAGYLADNFLDMAHFPFVHAATFGAEEPVVPPLDVARPADPSRMAVAPGAEPAATNRFTFSAVSEHPFLNREDPGVAAGIRPLEQRRRVTYRVHAPFHLVLRLDYLDAGGTNVIGFFLQPEDEDSCRIYSTIWRDDLDFDESRMASAVDFEVKVVEEDLALQETYDVRALPLDPTAEVHTRADRATLELRRMLADLVDEATAQYGADPGTRR